MPNMMLDTDREWRAFALEQLGQPVRLVGNPLQRTGYVVAVMLRDPYQALVHWTDNEATFESLDDLVDAR
jgi:hypothetical protein